MVLKANVQKVGPRLQAGCHVSFLIILRRVATDRAGCKRRGVAISSAMHFL